MKSLGVYYCCVKIPQWGCMEHGLKYITFNVQKHIAPPPLCHNIWWSLGDHWTILSPQLDIDKIYIESRPNPITTVFPTKRVSYAETGLTGFQLHGYLTHKRLEMHGCVISTVPTAALVPTHQAISSHSAEWNQLFWTSFIQKYYIYEE